MIFWSCPDCEKFHTRTVTKRLMLYIQAFAKNTLKWPKIAIKEGLFFFNGLVGVKGSYQKNNCFQKIRVYEKFSIIWRNLRKIRVKIAVFGGWNRLYPDLQYKIGKKRLFLTYQSIVFSESTISTLSESGSFMMWLLAVF